MMYNNSNNLYMPDRPSPGLTTSALSIGLSQDGREKLATGNITTKNKKIELALNITTIVTWNVRTLRRWETRGIKQKTLPRQMGHNWTIGNKIDRYCKRYNR